MHEKIPKERTPTLTLITESRNCPIGYRSYLFHKKHEFVLTHPKSPSSMVPTTQLMPAIEFANSAIKSPIHSS